MERGGTDHGGGVRDATGKERRRGESPSHEHSVVRKHRDGGGGGGGGLKRWETLVLRRSRGTGGLADLMGRRVHGSSGSEAHV